MELNEEELQNLIAYVVDGEERIKSAKRMIVENSNCFNLWSRFSITEDRAKYKSLLGINTELRKLIDKHISWLISEEYRGFEIDLDYVLEALGVLEADGVITTEKALVIKEELFRLNFGSMVIDW